MKAATRLNALAVAFAALLATAPAAAQDDGSAGEWTGQVTPYLWGSGLGGTLTPFTGAPTVRIDKSFSEVLEDSDGAFFLSAYARRDRLVLLGDVSYAASSKEGRVPPGLPAEGRLRQSSLPLAAGWRVHEGERVAFDLLGGLRHWDVRAAVAVRHRRRSKAESPSTRSCSRAWKYRSCCLGLFFVAATTQTTHGCRHTCPQQCRQSNNRPWQVHRVRR